MSERYLLTRFVSRLSWDSPVYISEKAEQEVKFWSDSVDILTKVLISKQCYFVMQVV